jgi:TolA-binding protein
MPGPQPSFEELRKRREAKRKQQQVINDRLRALDTRIKEMQELQRAQRAQSVQRKQAKPAEEIVNASSAKTKLVRRRAKKPTDNQRAEGRAPPRSAEGRAPPRSAEGRAPPRSAEGRAPPQTSRVAESAARCDLSGQRPLPLVRMRHNPSCPSFLRPPTKPALQDPFSMTV